ncbi:hypothetical protein EsH8_IX_000990 [Colletotrichum jinshuiense]
MQLTKTLLFTLVGTAFALPTEKRDLATIQGAVTSVQDSLKKLDTAVKAVGTDAASAAPILTAAGDVSTTIQKANTDIGASDALQLQEALGLQQTATDLTTSATTVVDDIIAKKSNFDMIGVSAQVLDQLKQQKDASATLGTTIVSKVPAIGQTIAQQSIDQITAALDKGIQAYSA